MSQFLPYMSPKTAKTALKIRWQKICEKRKAESEKQKKTKQANG